VYDSLLGLDRASAAARRSPAAAELVRSY
jgi:hypothetical protein